MGRLRPRPLLTANLPVLVVALYVWQCWLTGESQARLTHDLSLDVHQKGSNGSLCLAEDDKELGCANFACVSAAKQYKTSKLVVAFYAADVRCSSGASHLALRLKRNTDRMHNGLLAWNIICVAFNLIPVIMLTSVAIYYCRYQVPGVYREKRELKSIFTSLGYDEDSVLYKKVHDFIFAHF